MFFKADVYNNACRWCVWYTYLCCKISTILMLSRLPNFAFERSFGGHNPLKIQKVGTVTRMCASVARRTSYCLNSGYHMYNLVHFQMFLKSLGIEDDFYIHKSVVSILSCVNKDLALAGVETNNSLCEQSDNIRYHHNMPFWERIYPLALLSWWFCFPFGGIC